LRGGDGAEGENRGAGARRRKKTQQRKASKRDWSKKAEDFLSALSETCNVTLAAAEAGVSVSTAYRRRKADAGFRGA